MEDIFSHGLSLSGPGSSQLFDLMRRRYRRAVARSYVRARRFVFINILHANDPPYRLAMGLAIGAFVTMTPTIGLQMMLVVLLSWVLRANKAVGVPVVWISNPATFVPIFYPCYWLGRQILDMPGKGAMWWEQWSQPPEGFADATKFYWGLVLEIAGPLWLGCVIAGTIAGSLTYLIAFRAITLYRSRKPSQKALRWIRAHRRKTASES